MLKLEHMIRITTPKNLKILVLQMVMKHYSRPVDYGIYRLDGRSSKFDNSVSIYITKLEKMMKWQVNAYYFDPKDDISCISF